MIGIIDLAPSAPMPILLLGLLVWAIIAFRVVPKLEGAALFLFFALSARYLVTFFHFHTTKPMIGAQSFSSIVTLGIALAGLVLFRKQMFRFPQFLPVHLFIAALIWSGLWNADPQGTINAVIRQVVFLSVAVGLVAAIDREPNDGSVSNRLLAVYVAPILLQLIALLFDMGKTAETDGSVSYIGGYVHEGVFSILLLTGMVMVALAAGMSWRRRTVLLAVFYTALIFANYRTTIVSAVPILAAHVIFGSAAQFRTGMVGYVRTFAVVLTACIGFFVASLMSKRMADIGIVLTDVTGLIKPPADFDSADRGLLSGRIMIWNDYIFATVRSDISHLFFGFGPDSWQKQFSVYAHNVYISYIYELGLVGLAAFLWMVSSFLWMAMHARNDQRWTLVACHLAYLTLCLGTMPTFTIEGILLYATICGHTVYYRLANRNKFGFVMPQSATRLARAAQRRHIA